MDSGRSISGRLRDDGTDWIVRQWAIETGNDRVWQPYGRVNLWRDWVAAGHVVGGDQIPLREEAAGMEFAGGVTALLSPNFCIYAQARYQFAVDNTDGGRRQGACR
jgi:outer membrane autotransporter protein